MICSRFLTLVIALGTVWWSAALAKPRPVEDQPGVADAAIATQATTLTSEPTLDPAAAAIGRKLAALPTDRPAEEIKERDVLIDFYDQRRNAPLWLSETGLTDKAAAHRARDQERRRLGTRSCRLQVARSAERRTSILVPLPMPR